MTATRLHQNNECLCLQPREIVVLYVENRLRESGLSATTTTRADVYAECSAMCATVESLVAGVIRNFISRLEDISLENGR